LSAQRIAELTSRQLLVSRQPRARRAGRIARVAAGLVSDLTAYAKEIRVSLVLAFLSPPKLNRPRASRRNAIRRYLDLAFFDQSAAARLRDWRGKVPPKGRAAALLTLAQCNQRNWNITLAAPGTLERSPIQTFRPGLFLVDSEQTK
jgi:hypothetical protein